MVFHKKQISGDVVFFSYKSEAELENIQRFYIWDLDKTYLDTRFETLKGLFKIAVEKPEDKLNIPGAQALLYSLQLDDVAIYFITASPPQMEKRIRKKFALDKIYPYGIFFKDNLQNIFNVHRWSRIKQQVGFKLQALLHLRLMCGHRPISQILWGDDGEMDAFIYNLYSDICSGRLKGENLKKILLHFKVYGEQEEVILNLLNNIFIQDPVQRIYINLETDTDVEYYNRFGERFLATYSTFQVALDLFQMGLFNEHQVVFVGTKLKTKFKFIKEEIESTIIDLAERKILAEESFLELQPHLLKAALIRDNLKINWPKRLSEERLKQLWVPDQIDYLSLS